MCPMLIDNPSLGVLLRCCLAGKSVTKLAKPPRNIWLPVCILVRSGDPSVQYYTLPSSCNLSSRSEASFRNYRIYMANFYMEGRRTRIRYGNKFSIGPFKMSISNEYEIWHMEGETWDIRSQISNSSLQPVFTSRTGLVC